MLDSQFTNEEIFLQLFNETNRMSRVVRARYEKIEWHDKLVDTQSTGDSDSDFGIIPFPFVMSRQKLKWARDVILLLLHS